MTEEKIKEVLSGIMEPVSNSDFVSAGLIRNISLNGKKLILELATPETDSNVLVTLGVNIKNTFKEKIPEISEVAVNFTAGVTEHINSKEVIRSSRCKEYDCNCFRQRRCWKINCSCKSCSGACQNGIQSGIDRC